MLMSSVVVGFACVGGKGRKRGKGAKNGAVDCEHKASKGRGSQLRPKSYQSKYEGYSRRWASLTQNLTS